VRYLTLNEVLEIYRGIIENTGGFKGVRDLGSLESSFSEKAVKGFKYIIA